MVSGKPDHTASAFEVDVVSNHVVPCSYCGIPCTGTVRFWYADGPRRVTFELDRPTLQELLEVLVTKAIDEAAYPQLPLFVRNGNEITGWAAQAFDESTPIDAPEVLRTIELLLDVGDICQDPRLHGLLTSLRDFLSSCFREQRQLWICET